jgi:hypothetical protein
MPRGPHVGALGVQAGTVFLQAPAAREATGARGARQRWAAGGQTLQGPVGQSHAPPELPELDVLVEALEELDVLVEALEELDVDVLLAELAELDVVPAASRTTLPATCSHRI